MAIQQLLVEASQAPVHYWVAALLAPFLACTLGTVIYRLGPLHPFAEIPGPVLNRITYAPLVWHSYKGDEAQYVHKLHQRYGNTIRIAPSSVDFTEVAALKGIYLEKGGFYKSRYYNNFDIDGHASIFSNTDLASRAARAKVVLPLFSITSVKAGYKPFKDSLRRYLKRFKDEKETGRVNVLDLARGMSIDAVTEYLFGIRYGAFKDEEESGASTSVKATCEPKMSASDVVDNFISTSRLWYLSVWLYNIADKLDRIIYPNPGAEVSTEIVNEYADRVIVAAQEEITQEKDKSQLTFPARLLYTGISPEETRSHCKDIIFAGTDTIGMNLATVCFMLAKYPRVYDRLYEEVSGAEIEKEEDIQVLPYLNAVVKEGLRMSMTNPCRLPREVPERGWTYKETYYPPGTIVSCSAYEMHFSAEMFEKPFEFIPERWDSATDDMNKSMMAFGLGNRQCIARGMSMLDMHDVVYHLVKEDVLRGAKPVRERIEILEGFSSKVVEGHVDLIWDK
ncbi:unnamed protein product [Clonostachys chloroleuca]|uniref:Cytochrome P450 n=1 Tax=Clonostachys chloroleuca TaxID=1926264 RepID=A0AA35MDL5_9HYPO|nr:unnamed protein product [Clonostachys chloroleuca]